jgi:hypothetical protein
MARLLPVSASRNAETFARAWPGKTPAHGRGQAHAVVGFEFLTSVAVLVFLLLAEGFKRPSLSKGGLPTRETRVVG